MATNDTAQLDLIKATAAANQLPPEALKDVVCIKEATAKLGLMLSESTPTNPARTAMNREDLNMGRQNSGSRTV